MKNRKAYIYLLLLVLLAISSCNDTGNIDQRADLIIHNAKITTLNEEASEVEAVAISGNHILAVGQSSEILKLKGANTMVIDAKGKRIIPGLIDSHIHFIRQGNMPGHLVQEVENVTTIQEMIDVLSQKSNEVDNSKFITVMGGFVLKQLAENRLPTLSELSTSLPDQPVYIQVGFDGPCVVNQKGKEKLEQIGLKVNENGFFKKGKESMFAFRAVKGFQNYNDTNVNLKNLMAYANSLGLTGIHDEGGTNFPNSSLFDTHSDYDLLMALRKKGDISLRMRIQHVVYDKDTLDNLLEQKLNNTWQGFGDEMIKYWTVGEHIVSFPMNGKVNPIYLNKITKVAKDGWTHEQHSVSFDENKQHLSAIKQVHKKYSIADLRWTLSHVFELGHPKTLGMLGEVKRLKMGLRVQNHGYYSNTSNFPLGRNLGAEQSGPLFKTLLAQNIPLGAGTDGPLLGPMNPWFSIYYMVTGKDAQGKLVNKNETISRIEALKLQTLGSAWMSFDEDKLGSIEKGKLADFTILNTDYFSIQEENIKNIKSILTVVDGRIVYSTEEYSSMN